MKYIIDNMKRTCWDQVRSIYLQGIRTGNSTFETQAPDWKKWDANHLPEHRLVARIDDTVVGWTALIPVSNRRVYSGVAEVSLYIAAAYRGRGIGSSLLEALIQNSEKAGIWSLQAGIFPENTASLGLFKKNGFREIGRREKVGKMLNGDHAGKWRDVTLLERRSRVAGVD
ncbi:MAG: N-acetyltransferase [Deltaproteobacteria bacterium]|nr:N-acetyltransferase [Deltaproteobacteria bacterium]